MQRPDYYSLPFISLWIETNSDRNHRKFHYIHCPLRSGGLPKESVDQLILLRAGLILNTEHNTPLSLKGSFLIQQSQGKCSMAMEMLIIRKCSSLVDLLKCGTWKLNLVQTGHVLVKLFLLITQVWAYNFLFLLFLLINTSTIALSATLSFLQSSVFVFKGPLYSICTRRGWIYLEVD